VAFALDCSDRKAMSYVATTGGIGSDFHGSLGSAAPVTEPVIEAVMIGVVSRTGYSFVSQGRSLRTVAMN
jgi:hypothetical protein